MDGVLHHNYHVPEGPTTVEYLLDSTDRCAPDDPWIRSLCGLDSTEIRQQLQNRFDSLSEGPLANFCERLLACRPRSLVTFRDPFMKWYKDRWWLLLSLTDSAAPSAFGNMVMIPGANNSQFSLIHDSVCRQFLRQFAGVRNSIPPDRGFLWPDVLPYFTISETCEGWGAIPDGWQNSVGFYLPGSGDVLVIRPDGVIGVWLHEFGWGSQTESPIRRLADSFAEIVPDYVAHVFGGARNYF